MIVVISRWLLIIRRGVMPQLDVTSRGLVHVLAESNVYDMLSKFTWLVSASFLIPFTLIIGLLFSYWFRNLNVGIIFASGTLCSYIVNHLIKQLVARKRPLTSSILHAEGYSFPSGHAMIATVCYGLLLFFLLQKIYNKQLAMFVKWLFLLFIFLIGISRYLLNVHYLTDVIVGFMLGFILFYCFIHLFYLLQNRIPPAIRFYSKIVGR